MCKYANVQIVMEGVVLVPAYSEQRPDRVYFKEYLLI